MIWGALPQADGALIIIDGANNIPPREWSEFLEAIRTGLLVVNKNVPGQHPCRTRLLMIGNPGNPPQKMSGYTRAGEALPEMFTAPMIARLDFAIPFNQEDVDIEDINAANQPLTSQEQEDLEHVLRANIAQAWRVQHQELNFQPDAEAAILDAGTALFEEFEDLEVPLVSNDVKKKLARESISLALLCGRTTVTREDVDYVVREVRDLCRSLELGSKTWVLDVPLVSNDVKKKLARESISLALLCT